MDVTIQVIARMHSDFATKFGIPRQSGLVEELRSTIVFEPEFRNPDALRGIEDFSHLWIIWQFSEAVRQGWSPMVRPPRLGGNTRMGVFATRSPFRPNNLGLSSVKLLGVEHTEKFGTVLHVGGADLMDGTPIFDIKPYIPYGDCHPRSNRRLYRPCRGIPAEGGLSCRASCHSPRRKAGGCYRRPVPRPPAFVSEKTRPGIWFDLRRI